MSEDKYRASIFKNNEPCRIHAEDAAASVLAEASFVWISIRRQSRSERFHYKIANLHGDVIGQAAGMTGCHYIGVNFHCKYSKGTVSLK